MISLSNLLSEIELDGGFDLRPGDPLFSNGSDWIFIELLGDSTIVYGMLQKVWVTIRKHQIKDESFEKNKFVELKSGTLVFIERVIDENTAMGREVKHVRDMSISEYNQIKDLNI